MDALAGRIEAVLHTDVGRGMHAVFEATRGGLWRAASCLAGASRIGLITGFYVPGGDPPAAETDGPAGAALLARAFESVGVSCRLATDPLCGSACRVALDTAGAGTVPIDPVDGVIEHWRRDGVDVVIAIERCGPAADGTPRNMRGTDMSAFTAPFDLLFSAGPWRTIGIGDGGNELGMGSVPRSLIAGHVPLGAEIGCVVPADILIAAGVSHWGAYGLLAALARLRPDWSGAMAAALDPALDRAVLRAMVRDGPAVDGVSLRRDVTIDALPMDRHHAVLAAIRAIIF